MTREEAIQILKDERWYMSRYSEEYKEAYDMAIEALSQPIVAKHFDIQSGYIYCSPQDAENIEVVVRCKDCRHAEHREQMPNQIYCKRDKLSTFCAVHDDDDFCKYGERRDE